MEQVMSVYNWVISNSGTIVTTATAIVAAASAIAALTPTPKDDNWVKKAYTLIDWFALNVGKAKQQVKKLLRKKQLQRKSLLKNNSLYIIKSGPLRFRIGLFLYLTK